MESFFIASLYPDHRRYDNVANLNLYSPYQKPKMRDVPFFIIRLNSIYFSIASFPLCLTQAKMNYSKTKYRANNVSDTL